VRYAQCVKIWPFDVLVLFLMCVQFLKPCVQVRIDTILNLPMCSVSDGHYTKSANVFNF
jgi:hypothetical protein